MGNTTDKKSVAPHVQASFINAIAEEGTKQEAVEWLQRIWNELCQAEANLRKAQEENAMLEAMNAALRDQNEAMNDTILARSANGARKDCCGAAIYKDPGGVEYPCGDCPHNALPSSTAPRYEDAIDPAHTAFREWWNAAGLGNACLHGVAERIWLAAWDKAGAPVSAILPTTDDRVIRVRQRIEGWRDEAHLGDILKDVEEIVALDSSTKEKP